ncbi:MAG: PAS domain S-box protein, partial [Methanohalophilus sp.]
TSFTPASEPAINTIIYGHGPIFWVMIAYNYLILLAATVALIYSGKSSRRIYRHQTELLIIALAFPWIGNILYLLNTGPFPGQDITILGFTLTGFVLSINFHQFKFLDMVPLARERLMERMNEGIIVIDNKDRIADINNAALDIFGTTSDEIIGKNIKEILPDVANVKKKDGLNENAYYEKEIWINGTKSTYNIQATPLTDKKEEPFGNLIQLNDITESKRNEKILRESEEKYRAIVDNTHEMIYIYKENGFIFVNDRICEVTGYTKNDIYNMKVLDLIHPEEKEKIREIMLKRLNNDKAPSKFETRIITQKGNTRSVEIIISTIQYKGQNAALGSARDITERKNTENILLQAKVKAEEADRTKSEFMATMSHELRTPLNSIIGFSQMLIELYGNELTAVQKKYISNILNSGENLLHLINDILDISKIESGKKKVEPEFLEIQETLHDVNILIKPLAFQKDIEVDIDYEKANRFLYADIIMFKQIIYNLLNNAVKFTPKNGKIQMIAQSHDGETVFSVADNGIGIPEDKKEMIFEPFKQIDSAKNRRYEGTGLGLALVRNYVKMHGGNVWVESEEGKGSTFTFTIPQQDTPGK